MYIVSDIYAIIVPSNQSSRESRMQKEEIRDVSEVPAEQKNMWGSIKGPTSKVRFHQKPAFVPFITKKIDKRHVACQNSDSI